MQKYILSIVVIIFSCNLNAQTWKIQIQRVADDHKVKTLKMNLKTHVKIRTFSIDNDSLKKESKTYEGFFRSGTPDSITFKLDRLETYNEYKTGLKERITIPPKLFLKDISPDKNVMRIALTDVDYLMYQRKNTDYRLDNVIEPMVFASLFVMILSPLISYNYKEGSLNADRYKYWALGSTIGLTIGLGYVSIVNSRPIQKKFQFKEGWPEKKAKVWRFK